MAFIKVQIRNKDTGETFPMTISDQDPVPVIASGFIIDKSDESIAASIADVRKRNNRAPRTNRVIGSVRTYGRS